MKTKKELKHEYKQKKSKMGVFQIKNRISGKLLLDSSLDIIAKWNRHRTELRFGSHRNQQLQHDWDTYKEDSFVFEILSELDATDEANIDFHSEVKLLQDMVARELNINDHLRYDR